VRSEAYGERRALSPVDLFGVWLSARQVLRHASFNGKRVADFGCGYEASFARRMLPCVEQLLLVDVHLAEDLKRHATVNAIEGQLESVLPTLADASLDIVLCLSVIEHLDEPQRVLEDFHRILRPSGVALINVPSWRGKRWLELSAFRLNLSPATEMDDHKRYYDPRDLWPMLVRAGFRPRNISCRKHKFGLNTFAIAMRSGEATIS
jgi:SAM-dependent methyltransferase